MQLHRKLSKVRHTLRKDLMAMSNAFNLTTGTLNVNNPAAVELADQIRLIDHQLKQVEGAQETRRTNTPYK